MDRFDFFYQQLVAEADLDGAFDKVEAAIRFVAKDLALYGVASGLVVAEQDVPDLTVAVSAGIGYDKDGKRLSVSSTQSVDVSQDYAASSTAVTVAGQARWISVYLLTDRELTDPRVDGNDDTVYYDRAESFKFKVIKGASEVTPTRPTLLTDGILLADVYRVYGDTTITNAQIFTNRRELQINSIGSPRSLSVGTVREALVALLGYYNNHVTGGADQHPATAVSYAGGGNWADGTTNPADTVEATLDSFITKLSSISAGVAGVARIGADAVAGATVSLVAGTLSSQISAIVGALNTLHSTVVKLSGSQTITGAKIFDDLTLSVANLLKYAPRTITRVYSLDGAQFDSTKWEFTPTGTYSWRVRTTAVDANAHLTIPVRVPHNASISAVSARLVPNTGHGALPVQPTIRLVRMQRTGGSTETSLGSFQDNQGTVGAYETAHQLNLTGLGVTVDNTAYDYAIVITGESGGNALTHLAIQGVTVTFAVSEQDIG